MHQVAKAYICGAYAEIREGGETSPRAGAFRRSRKEHGNTGERNDNHGGREQGMAVDIRCKRQSTGSAVRKPEGTSLYLLRMLVEAGVRPCRMVVHAKQKIATTLELAVKISPISTPPLG